MRYKATTGPETTRRSLNATISAGRGWAGLPYTPAIPHGPAEKVIHNRPVPGKARSPVTRSIHRPRPVRLRQQSPLLVFPSVMSSGYHPRVRPAGPGAGAADTRRPLPGTGGTTPRRGGGARPRHGTVGRQAARQPGATPAGRRAGGSRDHRPAPPQGPRDSDRWGPTGDGSSRQQPHSRTSGSCMKLRRLVATDIAHSGACYRGSGTGMSATYVTKEGVRREAGRTLELGDITVNPGP